MAQLLEVTNLRTSFFLEQGEVRAVDGLTFRVEEGEAVAIVGESGCGKSATALSIVGLVPPPGKVIGGTVFFAGRELLSLSQREIRWVRGREIGMIFQDPMTSLNPVLTVGQQIGEALALHLGLRGRAARERMVELLRLVGIPLPELRLNQYPHQFSGGMRQRVMIAMALSCQPRLLIADEPTTALDVTIQAQIIELLKELKQRLGMAIILITHDLGVVAGLCSRLLVMYAGRLVETGSTRALYRNPCHPYTKGLLQSVPRLDAEEKRRLMAIPGQPPDLLAPPPGCRFHPRCPQAMTVCQRLEPPELEVEAGHTVVCWLYHPLAASALAASRKEQTV